MRFENHALRDLEARAWDRIARVQDEPEARYRLRQAFYRKYGFGASRASAGYGASELAFMRWEIERGLFEPLDHPERPGSPYWRAANAALCYYSELAALVHETGISQARVGREVCAWLDYFARPSPGTWYRAHTCSLIRGSIDHRAEARQEPVAEQRFINEALYRLIHAEAMVRGAVLGKLGRVAADPRLPAVHVVVQMESLYPRHYPLQPGETAGIATAWPHLPGTLNRSAERILIRALYRRSIVSALIQLYLYPLVSGALDRAELERRVWGGEPIYPEVTRPPVPVPSRVRSLSRAPSRAALASV
jgi:hypothetical protein